MAVSVIIVKRFTYRGDPTEEWSNRYFLTGADPVSSVEWQALVDALGAIEKTCYSAAFTKIVRYYGYTSDAENAPTVYVRDLVPGGLMVAGTYVRGSNIQVQGDAAATVRWKTSRLTSKGKAIYLRKFFHDVYSDPANPDLLGSSQRTAIEAFATKLWDGTFLDARKLRGRGQSSETIVGSACNVYLTTRTLKRRGKRPLASGA